jgi:PAS domain S-box-containing protein
MTQMEALLLLLRVLVVFLIILFWLLQAHFRRMEFFRWWTAAWVVFGVHLALQPLAAVTGWEIFLVGQLLAGYLQSPLMALGARQYDLPGHASKTLAWLGTSSALAAGIFFYGLSLVVRPGLADFTRGAPRRFILGLALAYCARVCYRRWRSTASRSALVNTCAFGLSSLNELTGTASWVGAVLEPSWSFLGVLKLHDRYELMIGMTWPMAVSIGMILLLLEEHRRTEAAELAASKARESMERNFAKAVRATPDAITISRLADGRYVEANEAFLRLSGYQWEEVIGCSSVELGLWADSQDRQALVERLEVQGTVQDLEVRMRRRDGEILTILASIELLELDGEPHLLVISKDITGRKKAEESLRASEERFASAFRSSPGAIAITTQEDGRLLDVNDSFVSLTGYSREEAVGRTTLELGLWASPGERAALLSELEQFGSFRDREIRLRLKSGREADALLSGELIELGGKPCLLSVVRDITEQKRAAEELRRSEAHFRDLFENANDIIFTIDLDKNFTSINRAGEQITGYGRDEIIGANIDRLLARKEADRAHRLVRHLLAGRTPRSIELEIIAKDGRSLAVEVSGRVLTEDGRPAGIEGIARDVTERKQLEAQLRQAQKMEAIGQLAGGLAHDFNNLLTVIMGYSDLLAKRFAPETQPGSQVRQMGNAADRAASLTRQLLAFSRKQILQPQVLDLNVVVSDTEKMLGRTIAENITLATRLDARPGLVKADQGQIEQVIMNLAVNARDAMPNGGVLTIQTTNVEITGNEFAAEPKPGKYVVLKVADTGIGMDESTRARIFEPFFTTKEPGKGTGLGLSTVHGIVKQSGGHIAVCSQPGSGTAFEVYLREVREEPQPRRVRPVQAAARGSETILLVEDESVLRELVRVSLEQSGFSVLSAASGEKALELVANHQGPIHLLLTDVLLPGVKGTEVAQRLQALRPGTKVIYMSGYADSTAGQLEAAACLLRKPFRVTDLTTRVREVLDEMKQSGSDSAIRAAAGQANEPSPARDSESFYNEQ